MKVELGEVVYKGRAPEQKVKLTKVRVYQPGRNSPTVPLRYMNFHCRLSEEEFNTLRALAARQGISMSRTIRVLIAQAVKRGV